jgi:hypothetical protein
VAGFLYVVGSSAIRTQGLAYPLFVAVVWLLAKAARSSDGRRVYLVFPLLIVWANLHGSVALGAALAVIYGITLLVQDISNEGVRYLRGRTAAFLLGPPACMLITPYGLSILGYYEKTLLNPTFGRLITEWRPVTSVTVLAVPCLGLALAAVWLLGRSGKRTPLFDHLALIVSAAAAVFAIRNITWFGLLATMLLPACVSSVVAQRRAAPRRTTLNLAIATLSLVVVTATVVRTAGRPTSWFEHSYDTRTLTTVRGILGRHPQDLIFADVRYSDWLLWHDPALAGKLAYDTRFELLTSRQLSAIAGLGQMLGSHDLNILAGYRILVLDRSNAWTKLVLSRPATRVVSRNSDAVVALTR